MRRVWQKRCLLLCVLALLSVQQLSFAHDYTHLGDAETGECLDCDALSNIKASLTRALPLFTDRFDAIDPAIPAHRPPANRHEHIALIRAPPAPKVL